MAGFNALSGAARVTGSALPGLSIPGPSTPGPSLLGSSIPGSSRLGSSLLGSSLQGSSLLAATSSQPVAATGVVADPRLVKAAHQFEAAMMKELMTPLEAGHGVPGEEDEELGSNSALGSYATEALSQAISEAGGFGVAKHIIQQLTEREEKSNRAKGVSVPHETESLFPILRHL